MSLITPTEDDVNDEQKRFIEHYVNAVSKHHADKYANRYMLAFMAGAITALGVVFVMDVLTGMWW